MHYIYHWIIALYLSSVFTPSPTTAVMTVYTCFTETATQNVTLKCPPGQKIKIQEALFGRNRYDLCYYTVGQTCTEKTNKTFECCGKNYCHMPVKRAYMTTCGYSNFLRVVYECVSGGTVTCGPDANKPLPTNIPTPGNPQNTPVLSSTGITIDTRVSTETTSLPWWKREDNYDTTRSQKIRPGKTTNNQDQAVVWGCLSAGLIVFVVLLLVAIYLWRKKYGPLSKNPKSFLRPRRRPDVFTVPDVEARKSPEGQPRDANGEDNVAYETETSEEGVDLAEDKEGSTDSNKNKVIKAEMTFHQECDDITAPTRRRRNTTQSSEELPPPPPSPPSSAKSISDSESNCDAPLRATEEVAVTPKANKAVVDWKKHASSPNCSSGYCTDNSSTSSENVVTQDVPTTSPAPSKKEVPTISAICIDDVTTDC